MTITDGEFKAYKSLAAKIIESKIEDWDSTVKNLYTYKRRHDIYIKVKKVIYHNPATIIFWSDGTKTVVKCGKDDTYDKEKGFYIACAKKLFGNDYKAVGRMNKALTMAETKEV